MPFSVMEGGGGSENLQICVTSLMKSPYGSIQIMGGRGSSFLWRCKLTPIFARRRWGRRGFQKNPNLRDVICGCSLNQFCFISGGTLLRNILPTAWLAIAQTLLPWAPETHAGRTAFYTIAGALNFVRNFVRKLLQISFSLSLSLFEHRK